MPIEVPGTVDFAAAGYNASEANATTPSGAGPAYGAMGMPGHNWFESSWVGLPTYGSSNNVVGDTRYYKGHGVLIPLGYMPSPVQFFHPSMREATISDTSGGARRHWYYTAVKHYDLITHGDPLFASPSNQNLFNWGSSFTTSQGLYISSTTMYRGGFWATYTGDNVTGGFVNDPSTVKVTNNRPDTDKFGAHVLLMNNPAENLFNRVGGMLNYARGDASVSFSTDTRFKSATGLSTNSAGSTPPALVEGGVGGPANGVKIPIIYSTTGAGYVAYGTVAGGAGTWNYGFADGYMMDIVDKSNSVSP
jgi:hypothetical protein